MDKAAMEQAIAALGAAERTGVPIGELPHASRPASVAEALGVQDRVVAGSGKKVAGWKVATSPEGEVTYGAIYADDCFASPATIEASRYRSLGIEAEVAFRFGNDLPRSGERLTREAMATLLIPFPVFEIVASRFASYANTPAIIRLADRMSNGGMVIGEAVGRPSELDQLPVRLAVDGEVVVDQIGGHSRGDPLLPAMEFVNALHATRDFAAGQFITAGTLTGLRYGLPGQRWEVSFAGLGSVQFEIS